MSLDFWPWQNIAISTTILKQEMFMCMKLPAGRFILVAKPCFEKFVWILLLLHFPTDSNAKTSEARKRGFHKWSSSPCWN